MYRAQNFRSFEEFNAFNHGWDADFRALNAGDYCAHLEQFAGQQTLVNIGRLDSGTVQRGATPQGMRTFALPINLSGQATWLNQKIAPLTLMLFPRSGELFSVSSGSMHMATVSFKEELFERIADTYLPTKLGTMDAEQTSELLSPRWHQLHKNLRSLLTFSVRYGELPEASKWLAYMEEELANSFISSLPGATHSGGTVSTSAGATNTRRAVDYIMGNLREPFSISSICRDLKCSRRTLETSFRRSIGTSPLTFIKFQRLSQCRAELLASTREEETVTSIASGWNFRHLAQFSADYKAMFGESPSSTLARNPQRR